VSGSIVTPDLRQRVRGIATPVAVAIGRLGLTPNHLTLVGFVISIGAAVVIGQQGWLFGAVLLIVGGVFDLFDGALARATGQASRLGAFMDSVFDRAGEGVVYVGIAAACVAVDFDAGSVLAASAMAAAFMVSYVRAKSESLGYTPGSRMASVGLAPREIRIVILTVGLLLTSLAGGIRVMDDPSLMALYDSWGAGRWHLAATLLLITILAAITAIQRIVHVMRQSSSKEQQ
jgi:CDP-diacylglycerol---glycerol-3-phosphate 3-phosphatidyltransferase